MRFALKIETREIHMTLNKDQREKSERVTTVPEANRVEIVEKTQDTSCATDMTLEDAETEKMQETKKFDEGGLSDDLKEMLIEAQEQDRLTCGIYESGKLLEMNPDGIMLCVLPENSANDITLHIHFTLIEAFCWENDIRIIKVDSVEKVAKLLEGEEETSEVENQGTRWSKNDNSMVVDYNCLLIEYPSGKCSPAEEKLLDFHRVTCDLVPQPVIPLEV